MSYRPYDMVKPRIEVGHHSLRPGPNRPPRPDLNWMCTSRFYRGYGETPTQAYEVWKRLWRPE